MGMFDSLYDSERVEWQTKAYSCILETFDVGDTMPRETFPASYPHTYQVEVLGGRPKNPYTDSFATVRDDVLTEVPCSRDTLLPLINYGGHLVAEGSI